MKNLLLLLGILCTTPMFAQPTSFSARGVGGGGALFFPTINPANDNEYYVACDMSELFHSTDWGLNYSMIPFTKLQVFNTSTYEFTNNPNIAYSLHNDGNVGYPVKTTDGGATWQPLSGNPDPSETIYKISANYYHPNQILLGQYGALYFSTDGGSNFNLIHTAANSGAGVIIAGTFYSNSGDTIFIATNDGILHSTNGGTSFSTLTTTGLPSGEAIWSFAGAQSGNTIRFFCLTANSSDIYNGVMPWDYYGFMQGVYSMDFGTNAWSAKMSGINTSNDMMMYVGMAWNDINTVYLGGNNQNTGAPNVLKTTNAGTSWSAVFLDAGNQNITTGWSGYGGDRPWGYGETCFGISVAPFNSNKVLFGDFGFVHKTNDGGNTWIQAYVAAADQHTTNATTPTQQYYHSIGLENTTSWQVLWSDATNLFAGFSDIKGIRSIDGGSSWGFSFTGNNANSMYRLVKQPTTNTLFAATSSIHDMYQSTRLADAQLDANDTYGKVIYSTNQGATWQDLHVFNHPVFWLALDPNNSNKMYASVIHYGSGTGQGGIWVSSDLQNLATSVWTKLPNPPRTEGHPASIEVLNDGNVVATYSGRRTGAGFTASSGVFLYNVTTQAWTDVSDAGMHYWTKDIVLDPSDAAQNTWYVAVFSGWGGAPNGLGGLYKTTNRGTSWTKLTGTQFDRVTSITFNPANHNQAFLTTETQGLWFSTDMNATTPTWTLVQSYPFRQPERVYFNPFNNDEVWVTSFGNGLKMGTMTTTGLHIASNPSEQQWTIYPNPAHEILQICQLPNAPTTIRIANAQGQIVSQIVHKQGTTTQLDIAPLPQGMYFINIGNRTQGFVKK